MVLVPLGSTSNPMEARRTLPALLFGMLLLISPTSSQTPDQTCVGPLETLLVCLPYAQGKAQVPSAPCCTNMLKVFQTNKKCLCELMAASTQGTAGGLPPLNQTLALSLPGACNLKQADPRECPGLLGISPSSPQARIFYTPASSSQTATGGNSTTASTPSTTSKAKHTSTATPNEANCMATINRNVCLMLSAGLLMLLNPLFY